MNSLGPLQSGGHVIVLGGGPAGTACALALMRKAEQLGRTIQVTIVEAKEFSGERHHNQCLGVLSPPLTTLVEKELDVPFPWALSRGEIHEYVLHGKSEHILLRGEGPPSIALRRVQYDAYMLGKACEKGIGVSAARAVDLELNPDGVVLYTDNHPIEGDVVVGAFGLDEGTAVMFERTTRYRRPRALSTVVTKYHPGDDAMLDFGPRIHAFLPTHPRIEFAAVTPKGNHLTLLVAGRRVDAAMMNAFLQLPQAVGILVELSRAGEFDSNDMRYFKGRFPRSLARGFYGDRYVMVGDAAGLLRAFKGKGVTEAINTGIRAADCILQAGISGRAFHDHYQRANQGIIRDMPYGSLMRLLAIGLARSGWLDVVLRAAKREPRLRQALYHAVSGQQPYRHILAQSLNPKSMLAMARGLLPRRRPEPSRVAID